jgi:hypothetical protein
MSLPELLSKVVIKIDGTFAHAAAGSGGRSNQSNIGFDYLSAHVFQKVLKSRFIHPSVMMMILRRGRSRRSWLCC